MAHTNGATETVGEQPAQLARLGNRFAEATVHATMLPDFAETVKRYEEFGLTTAEGQRMEGRSAYVQTIAKVGLLATGEVLVEAHAETEKGKGAWELFLSRCGMSEGGARNYMAVYREFKEQPEVIKLFKPSSLYALAQPSTPEDVRKEIIDQAVTTGKAPAVAEVSDKIKEAKEAQLVPSAKFAELMPEQKSQVNTLYADLQAKRQTLAQWPVKEQATKTYHSSRQIHERAYNKAVGQMDKLSRTLNFDWRAQIDAFHNPEAAALSAAGFPLAGTAPAPSAKAVVAREPDWTPAGYGIAGKKATFEEWGVGDELTTHDGRVALTHGQPTKQNRQVLATFVDGTDEELAGFGFVSMSDVARHRSWAKGFDRKEYKDLMQRISEARQRQKSAAQKAMENEPAPYLNGNGNGNGSGMVNRNGILVREVVETVPDAGTAVEDDFAGEDDFDGEETIAIVDLEGDRQAIHETNGRMPVVVAGANFAEHKIVYAPAVLEEEEVDETLRLAHETTEREQWQRSVIQFHIRNELIRIITEAHLRHMPEGADDEHFQVQLPPDDELATACDTIRTIIREQVGMLMEG